MRRCLGLGIQLRLPTGMQVSIEVPGKAVVITTGFGTSWAIEKLVDDSLGLHGFPREGGVRDGGLLNSSYAVKMRLAGVVEVELL